MHPITEKRKYQVGMFDVQVVLAAVKMSMMIFLLLILFPLSSNHPTNEGA